MRVEYFEYKTFTFLGHLFRGVPLYTTLQYWAPATPQ